MNDLSFANPIKYIKINITLIRKIKLSKTILYVATARLASPNNIVIED